MDAEAIDGGTLVAGVTGVGNMFGCGAKAVWIDWPTFVDCSRVSGGAVTAAGGVDSESGDGKGFIAVEEGGGSAETVGAALGTAVDASATGTAETVEETAAASEAGETGLSAGVVLAVAVALDAGTEGGPNVGVSREAEMRLQGSGPLTSASAALVVSTVAGWLGASLFCAERGT